LDGEMLLCQVEGGDSVLAHCFLILVVEFGIF
jgi:hypothetical protein